MDLPLGVFHISTITQYYVSFWLFSLTMMYLRFAHVVEHIFFPNSHVWMWGLDHKEAWAPKNWCFRTVMLEKTLLSPLDSKEIKQVNAKGNKPWIFVGRTDAEAEAPVLWPPDVKSWLTGKDPDAGKDGRQKEKGMREWGGWMASLTPWTWVWANSGR